MSKSMSSYFGQDPFEAFDEGVKLFVDEIARQADWVMESGIFLPSICNNLSPSIWHYLSSRPTAWDHVGNLWAEIVDVFLVRRR